MNELATTHPASMVPAASGDMDPGQIILHALDRGVPVETMERLLAMRERLQAERARNAFFADLAAFQRSCPVIHKDKDVLNKDGRSIRYRYAPLESIIRQVGGLLADHGFAYQFTTETTEKAVSVTCHARHRDGHTETTSFVAMVDPTAYMNLAQKFGSALTFGKRYAFLAAFGIMTGEEDDDAQSTGETAGQKTARERMEKIRRDREAADRAAMPDAPIIHGGDPVETDDADALAELMDAVANCCDPDELTLLAGNANAMEGAARKAARIAVAERAKALSYTWDADAGEFVIGGGGAE